MRLLYLRSILLFLLMTACAHSAPRPLEQFLWKNRLVLVETSGSAQDQVLETMAAQRAAIEERHVIWFVFTGNKVESNFAGELPEGFQEAVRAANYFNDPDKPVLLIGKDGGIKARQTELDLAELFRRIDSMPMRRAEMREDN